MALIVEDGSVVAGADSYASLALFKTYSDNFGFDYSAMTDTQIEQCLRKATVYMVQKYRSRWKGIRVQRLQSLDWPRTGVSTEPSSVGTRQATWYLIENFVVPLDVQNACILMAQKAFIDGDLYPDGTQRAAKETVGSISVEYVPGSLQRVQYDAVEALLAVYLLSTGNICVGMTRG